MRPVCLLLFALVVIGCGVGNESREPVSITWENKKAVGVSIDQSLLPSANADSISQNLNISVQGSEYSVLGTVDVDHDVIRFTPSVQFEQGQTYNVSYGKDQIRAFTVPFDSSALPPKIVGSYPSCDTVPENLLKIYLAFDQPMMEGRSQQFVLLLDATTGDTVHGAFLDLQPELWNEDQTILTLWLDPGRIKRDLIPNKQLGAVLDMDHQYTLLISEGWKSKAGQPTRERYKRNFVTGPRDSGKPDITSWNVNVADLLEIDTKESLDWLLLNNSIAVWKNDEEINGTFAVEDCDRRVIFTPKTTLTSGNYTLKVESVLEDLAGNNFNRLFETDVTGSNTALPNKPVHVVAFTVR
jgi:hypothetical protein